MSAASDNLTGLRASLERLYAVFVKELIQLRRDRLTFATMIAIPVMQLILFGFAINSDPKHLPTAVLDNDHSAFSRLFITSLKATDYFDIRYALSGPEEIDPLILSGAVNFAVEIPQDFGRKLARGEDPAILVVADAAALDRIAARFAAPDVVWARDAPNLEDVFIDMMSRAQDNYS